MKLVSYGDNAPETVNVIIEIPAHSDPIKYEVDKDSGAIFVDRFLATSMHYPCNYGYIPNTLADDGDPADVLVVTPFPVNSGAVVACRPIGVLSMKDESGDDAKILAVPVSKLCSLYDNIKSIDDMPKFLIAQIEHFFTHYKDLECDKWVKVDCWRSAEDAKREIMDSIERYKSK